MTDVSVSTQREALLKLGGLVRKGSIDPLVRKTAVQIVRNCAGRDDTCELEAVFNAVKYGDQRVRGLEKGFKYVADPIITDYFVSPHRSLSQCLDGACGSDCDDHASLVAALTASIGFNVGLCAYGPGASGPYRHVYALALYPKQPPHTQLIGMDTSVKKSYLGWQPPAGHDRVWLLRNLPPVELKNLS